MNFEKIMNDVEDTMYELDSDLLEKAANEGINLNIRKNPYDEMLEASLNLYWTNDSNLYQETLEKEILNPIIVHIRYLQLLKKAFENTVIYISKEEQRLKYDIYSEDE